MRALIAIAGAALLAGAPAARAAAPPDLGRYVNVFAGTQAGAADFGTGGGAGNTFPGATVPFGMVQWSPDTTPSALNVSVVDPCPIITSFSREVRSPFRLTRR